jgi:RecA-family ATPase
MKVDLISTLNGSKPDPDWLVPGLLHRGNMVIWSGDPGIGKSFTLYSAGMALACGTQFLGRLVSLGRTLYFDEENSLPDLHSYLHDIWSGYGRPDSAEIDKWLRIEHFTLSGERNPYECISMAMKAHVPDLVVIDTATVALDIKDENSNSEATIAMRSLHAIRSSVNPRCCIVILKHSRVDHETGRRDIRGAKAWRGGCDSLIFHVGARGRPPASGLRKTALESGKCRAYGLRDRISIEPLEVNGGILLAPEKPKKK